LPPVFSAIKKDGKKLYESARAGVDITPEPRTIHIHSFEITAISLPFVHFRVVCSKGTYIRSLAYDFGKALKSGAYLHELCRTRSGDFRLTDAYELTDFLKLLEA
jgi:tRNA pseudouridine55 synthase